MGIIVLQPKRDRAKMTWRAILTERLHFVAGLHLGTRMNQCFLHCRLSPLLSLSTGVARISLSSPILGRPKSAEARKPPGSLRRLHSAPCQSPVSARLGIQSLVSARWPLIVPAFQRRKTEKTPQLYGRGVAGKSLKKLPAGP
jgi:hypothetical protein